MSSVTEQIEIEVDGQIIIVELLDDGTFRKPDYLADAEREVVRVATRGGNSERRGEGEQGTTYGDAWGGFTTQSAPATASAREWAGWGTALKPAIEDWWVFRKPLSESTVASNVLRWGCGALNIDAGRVGTAPRTTHANGNKRTRNDGATMHEGFAVGEYPAASQRWPANLITDGSPDVVAMFPMTTSGALTRSETARAEAGKHGIYGRFNGKPDGTHFPSSEGSASRFFAVCPLDEDDYSPLYYCAKANWSERNEGLEDLPKRERTTQGRDVVTSIDRRDGKGRVPVNGRIQPAQNFHPTVKPLSLMRYLITLCTREGATVLDPFLGSGTTGVAAVQLGRSFIGVELDPTYFEIAEKRIAAALVTSPTEIELPLFAEVTA